MNWNRSQLKQMARTALQGSYWRAVLAAFLISLTTASFSSSGAATWREEAADISSDIIPFLPIILSVLFTGICLGVALRVLVLYPLEVGCRRFFLEDIYYLTDLDRLKAGFAGNYWNVVKVMFLRGLFVFFWTCLLIIPGIVKSYEYRMIPYLLAEDPNMSSDEAFAISKQMMDGEKMNAFVLDLSFIGWAFLSVITLGIVGIFFYQPYLALTQAALYHALKEKIGLYFQDESYYNAGYDSGSSGAGGCGSAGGQSVSGGYENSGYYNGSNGNRGFGSTGGQSVSGGYDNSGYDYGSNGAGGYGSAGGQSVSGGYYNGSYDNGSPDYDGYDNSGSYGYSGDHPRTDSGEELRNNKNPWAADDRSDNPWDDNR